MAKITTEQAIKLNSNNSKNNYFNLKNDGDKMKVRFMYNKLSEIETYAVHEVEVRGFNRHVDCLKDGEGNGNCPFCEKGIRKTARTFFKLYNIDTNTVLIWDCGIKKAPIIENILKNACDKDKSIVNYVFEIVRQGKVGDTNTSYNLTKEGCDDVTLDVLPEPPELYGRFIMKKTPEEMEYYITHNKFADKEETIKKRENGRMAF